ncbi:MAG: hypothetical protein JWO95_199 [Verrucomicrobiales bacterium]|nr:hypothetical protein [Verrucomicrobiales bacterium]
MKFDTFFEEVSPFHVLSKFLRRPRVDFNRLKATVIVSTGRTGTCFLARLLNKPELGMYAVHEPDPTLVELGYDVVTGRKPVEHAKSVIIRERANIFSAARDKLYIESNGGLIFLLQPLKELIPNLKVIHVVRHPVDIVRSGVNRCYISKGRVFQTYAEDQRWKLRTTDFSDATEDWGALDIYERFMWTWALKNNCAARFVRENPAIGLTVRFEDIFHSADHNGFYSMLDFLNLAELSSKFSRDDFKQVVNGSKAAFAEPFEAWPSRRKASLERICGPVVRDWDYQYSIANGQLA